MSQVLVNFRMDSDLKKEMEEVCTELGLSMTAAFTIFARKMVREQGIPFDVSIEPQHRRERKAENPSEEME